jgi:hypothetical protein
MIINKKILQYFSNKKESTFVIKSWPTYFWKSCPNIFHKISSWKCFNIFSSPFFTSGTGAGRPATLLLGHWSVVVSTSSHLPAEGIYIVRISQLDGWSKHGPAVLQGCWWRVVVMDALLALWCVCVYAAWDTYDAERGREEQYVYTRHLLGGTLLFRSVPIEVSVFSPSRDAAAAAAIGSNSNW